MSDEKKSRKVIFTVLASLLVGTLLYIFGLSIDESPLILIVYYPITLIMYISALFALIQQYKNNKHHIYMYLIILTIFFILFVTYTFVNHI